MDSGLNW